MSKTNDKPKRVPQRDAEAVFRSHYPAARVEGHTGHDRKRYYLVRVRGESMYVGSGNTKPQAWADACDNKNITSAKDVTP